MLEIFQYDFMQRAFIAGIMIAILASLSGSFLVLKRYSLMSETLSHAALVGVALAMLLDVYPIVMAVVISLLSAWTIEFLRSYYKIYSDSILAIFLSGSLALAVVIVSLADSFNSSLFSYLFGSILAVSENDIYAIMGFGSLALAILFYFHKEFYFIAFDEEVAQVSGINVKRLNFIFISVVAIIIALSIKIVGSLLIGALMVMPMVSALRYRLGFVQTTLLSLLFGVSAVIIGLFLSYFFSLPSGATIVLVILVFFLISLLVNRR